MKDDTVFKMPWSDNFIKDDKSKCIRVKGTSNGEGTANAVNAAFQEVIDAAIDSNIFPKVLHGHSEMYLIAREQGLITIERFGTSLFGTLARGVYLTGYKRVNGSFKFWVSRRGSKVLSPNKLDMTAAGGVRADQTPLDCLLQEASEEASLDPEFVRKNAKKTDAITYVTRHPDTELLYSCIMYGYQLDLQDKIPKSGNVDEVAEFTLRSVEEVQAAMLHNGFRAGCSLFMIDFFMRHGIITKEHKSMTNSRSGFTVGCLYLYHRRMKWKGRRRLDRVIPF